MESYLESCKTLSLTAREAIALLIIERFCNKNSVNSDYTTEFLEYMWQYPLIRYPDEFCSWEEAKPELVNCGLGDSFPEALKSQLQGSGVSEHVFRTLIEGTVEILWSSFWGSANNQISYESLKQVIIASKLHHLPCLTPFKFSLFHEGDGWGKEKITNEDVEFWRKTSQIG
ncbi:hypothetical protein [Marinobacter sp. CA1]|uniref:hypothetical protein n=1 Tax=Marinobacter sp. CA1 TaxID=2817656 RepID=UPI001D05CE5D|nr:hypothetical protein [Marinobacter sp. CA1]UDL07150.1 hypothetical protein J2887_10525 [Marinobacter sp. CA1]